MDNVEFSNIQRVSIEPGFGGIGIDITLENGQLPCKTPSDASFGACQNLGSYAYSYEFGHGRVYCGPVPDDPENEAGWQQFGIFITNSLRTTKCFGQDREDIVHNWGQRIVRADVEIYPWISSAERRYDPAHNVYGGARFSVTDWSWPANGGRYSPPIGRILLPSRNDVHGLLNGYVWEDRAANRPAKHGRLAVDMFQQGGEPVSSTGYRVEGFASTGVMNDEGYYTSGPLYPGRYLIWLTDMQNGQQLQLHRDVTRPFERIDFEVSANGPPREVSTARVASARHFRTASMPPPRH